jgi:hypothetical protein
MSLRAAVAARQSEPFEFELLDFELDMTFGIWILSLLS